MTKTTPPEITVERVNGPGGCVCYVIVATSHARTMPAGERLFRARPWPDIAFRHATQEAAERDAEILRKYLANPPSARRGNSEEAEVPSVARRGWWEL